MPISRDTFVYNAVTEMPDITNVLRLPELSCRHSKILSAFCNVTYTYRHTVRFGYPNITESVLRSPRSQLAVERTVQELLDQQGLPLDENSKAYKKEKKKCEGKLKKLFHIMNAMMSIPLFKITGWFLNTVLGALLNSVQVHNSQLLVLKDATLIDISSHILVRKAGGLPANAQESPGLYTLDLHTLALRYPSPYVAAGDNLNIFGFGRILRSLGGFFIRRRLDKEVGKKDHLYRAVLSEYLEELLRRGQSLEFFIEGGRSRSGKAYYPKAGLLSIIVDWVLASRNETDGILRLDALIVPVGISYEKIIDGDFTREQMGMAKKPESFWSTVKAIWKLFSTTYGNVRVDFCQPFSLKEYLTVNERSLLSRSVSGLSPVTVLGNPRLQDSMQDLSKATPSSDLLTRATSGNSIYGIDISKEDEKVVIDALARHILYNSMCATAIMSTNILAFDLLSNYRQGVSLPELISSITKLRETILTANRDVGFVGQTRNVIAHACKLLGSNLVAIERNGAPVSWQDIYDEEGGDQVKITPNLSLPHVLELSYYSSSVISVFQLKSLLACSICAASGVALLDSSTEDQFSSVSVTKHEVVEHAIYLANLFKYEFLFIAPCKDLETELSNSFESLISSELILSPEAEDTFNEEAQQWTSRIARKAIYGFHEEELQDHYVPDKQYKLNEAEKDQFRR
ncbi:GPAM [Bugula neritina]|uniref:GPAM n=1 Tax=Bugula neritina TaxID=10212 RepID=A0A7J7KSW1_BUGNE|nr:GPAM [Bugula neritina]